MAENVQESFNNLLDIIIDQESKSKKPVNASEVFRFLMVNTFFKREAFDNRSFSFFLERIDPPSELHSLASLKDIDIELLRSIINRDSVDRSFAGHIMLSKTYLKNFHPNHPNEIAKMPMEIRLEMRENAVKKNKAIIEGFEKMKKDMEADKQRKVITLIALSLKNIKRRTGRPVKNLDKSIGDIIKEHFPNHDEIFTANRKQLTLLSDQSTVRELLKLLFAVKSFKEIKNLSDLFAKEIERFVKRAQATFPTEG